MGPIAEAKQPKAEARPDQGLQPAPQQVDEYRIIRLVSSGERFAIYRAVGPQGDVALKIAVNRSATDLARLRRERELTAHLDLPGVRRIESVRQSAEGYIYAVMQWGERSLRDEMAGGRRLTRAEVLNYLMPVARTLDAMHLRQYIHCNLTPEHILILPDGQPVLAGLAGARYRGQHPGPCDPRYASPERAAREPAGPWGDIYSLGVIAYEMLAGRLPFAADTEAEWQRAHAVLMPEVPQGLRRALGQDASRALLRALAKEPADRFHSAEAFIEVLLEKESAWNQLRNNLADGGRRLLGIGKHVPRLVKVAMLVLLMVAASAGLVLSSLHQQHTPPPDPRTATAQFLAALQTPDTIWTPQPRLTPPTADATEAAAAATVSARTSVPPTPTVDRNASPTPTHTPEPTPTPEAQALYDAPVLVEPADVTRFGLGQAVDLVWQFDQPLKPGESFDIRMWKQGEPAWGIARSTDTRYRLNAPPHGAGEYSWMVVVVRDDEHGNVIELSQPSAIRHLSWG